MPLINLWATLPISESDKFKIATLNSAIQIVDNAIAGQLDINTVGGTTTLTGTNASPQAQYAYMNVTGVLASNAIVEIPVAAGTGRNRNWIVKNTTTGAFTLTIRKVGGTGVIVPQSSVALLYYDGTDVAYLTAPISITAGATPQTIDSLVVPIGIGPPINTTALTASASGTTMFLYLGRVDKAINTVTVMCQVATAAVTITWAEVAIFKGSPVARGNASLTRAGFTDVAATFNTTGPKSTVVALTGVNVGDDLWVAFGSLATTPFQIRGTVADEIQTGGVQTAAVRPSLATTPQAVTLAGAAVVPGWLVIKW